MRKLLWLLLLGWCVTFARGAVLSVEFTFTPFTGDPASATEVATVPGQVQVFLNNVLVLEQETTADKLPVDVTTHQVTPAFSVPMGTVGPAVRKGANKFRLEFTPKDLSKTYRAELRWTTLTDEPAADLGPGEAAPPNPGKEGVDDRKAVKGKAVFERDFTADFALDLPWHHYPAVTSLSDDDKQKIDALLQTRADWFKPNFDEFYKAIEENETIRSDDLRQAKCLDAAYQAGLRVTAPSVADLDFVISGGPEVLVRRKSGPLFAINEQSLAGTKDEVQSCAASALAVIYPGRLAVVHQPDGSWRVVY